MGLDVELEMEAFVLLELLQEAEFLNYQPLWILYLCADNMKFHYVQTVGIKTQEICVKHSQQELILSWLEDL